MGWYAINPNPINHSCGIRRFIPFQRLFVRKWTAGGSNWLTTRSQSSTFAKTRRLLHLCERYEFLWLARYGAVEKSFDWRMPLSEIIWRFCVDSRVWHETPEGGRRTYRPKRCDYNNKDEVNSPNILRNSNNQVSSQKFWKIVPLLFYVLHVSGTNS